MVMPDTLTRPVAETQQRPRLLCVSPDRIGEVWPHLEKHLASAYDRGIGDDDLATTKAEIDAGRQRLWFVWDGESALAALATKLQDTPTKRLCLITACGGHQLSRWRHLIAVIEHYAVREQCDAVRFMGRRGWQDVFTDYYQPWVCLQKDLKD